MLVTFSFGWISWTCIGLGLTGIVIGTLAAIGQQRVTIISGTTPISLVLTGTGLLLLPIGQAFGNVNQSGMVEAPLALAPWMLILAAAIIESRQRKTGRQRSSGHAAHKAT
ncbi:MAG: hypothetical protein AB8F65_06360 [Woeseiaceae bacterium]